jgi:hypothetical protein
VFKLKPLYWTLPLLAKIARPAASSVTTTMSSPAVLPVRSMAIAELARLLMTPQKVMSVMRCRPVHGRQTCSEPNVSTVSAGGGPART